MIQSIDDKQIELGVTLAPEFQGQGFADEAIFSLLDCLFLTFKKHRVIAIVDVDNKPCYKLFKRIGFRQEAHFVKNTFFKGSWGSEYLFAMLASDWLDNSE